MRANNIDDINISQICHALAVNDDSGNEVFVNVYPHKVTLELFEGGAPVVVEVRQAEPGEQSRYWAWYCKYSKQPYKFVWPSKEKTLSCVPNYKQRTQDKEGKIVNVVVERWNKL